MLLEFRTKNYKLFRDETIFSLEPASTVKSLDYSLLHRKISKRSHTALSTAVIYGANAAGKTNILGAIETFRSIVSRGSIRNIDTLNESNSATNSLQLIPNCSDNANDPVDFAIKFIVDKYLIEYNLSLDLGAFLDSEHKRKVLTEELVINGELIFLRDCGLRFGSFECISSLMIGLFDDYAEGAIILAKSSLSSEELFLMNGFKSMFSSKLVMLISSWLNDQLTIVYGSDPVQGIHAINNTRANSAHIDASLGDALTRFGITANTLTYLADEESNLLKLFSILGDRDDITAVPADLFESLGTIRFANMYPILARTLLTGSTLVIDEFDTSISSSAIMSLINIFHNDEINVNGAQLIFTTHNPIFMNPNLFRQDEIKFVERDDETHFSTVYSLSDFYETDRVHTHESEDYTKNYLAGRYGAIQDIDLSPVFESMINQADATNS